MEASGVRLGTAAVTTRGLDADDMKNLAGWIADVLERPNDPKVTARVSGEVAELAKARPIYGEHGTA